MDHDWRDIENTVWVQDVPQRPSPIPHEPKADDFPSVFERVLYAINVAPAITSLVSTDVRRTQSVSCPIIPLTRSTEAPQHSAHSPACRCAPHSLGLLPRTTSARPEPRREARGLARCPQVGAHGPHARSQQAQPATAGRLARVPGLSSLRETSEYPKTLTGIVHWGVQRRVARRVCAFFARYQPRGGAQRAEITPRDNADARARHAKNTVPDGGLGARQCAGRSWRRDDVLSEEHVGSRQVPSEPVL